jgi:hypothetical protein
MSRNWVGIQYIPFVDHLLKALELNANWAACAFLPVCVCQSVRIFHLPHFLTTELLDNLILIPVGQAYIPNLHQPQIELEI